ncbi:MAG: glutaredoxin [Actinobacteria bacterium]|nr:glutaredoxin [Actinomycetota bacterium]
MTALEVTLLTQDACGFCDDAKAILDRLADDHPIRVVELDLGTDEGRQLAERSGVLFPPGILFDGDPISYGRPSERRLRKELRRRLDGR